MADYDSYQDDPKQIAAANLTHGAANKSFSPSSQE